ncbi:hypothetical protein PFISCL1PPCAC_24820, partial [Pristionchus fissidentatus]
ATEIVEVITMIGDNTGIDQTVLGLTIIACANSIGDLVADRSIARQGYCRMVMAAALGGPLFNLLVGFGIPFTITSIRQIPLTISLDSVSLIMITFLFCSLLFTTLNLLIFRAQLKRNYGIALIMAYCTFVVFVVLSASKILIWL